MTNISSNTLFHFTPTKDNLLSILTSKGFYVRYNKENLYEIFGGEKESWYMPMVCFCDIPLKQIKNHTKFYGKYGIGLKKNWGKKNEINPILYTYKGSAISIHLGRLLSDVFDTRNEGRNPISQSNLLHLLANLKLYEGETFNKLTQKNEVKVLYNEREWRYNPPVEDIDESIQQFHVLGRTIIKEEDIKHENEKLKSRRLKFEAENIKYILIEEEEDIAGMVELILNMKDYQDDEKHLLVSKIISLQQIDDDF